MVLVAALVVLPAFASTATAHCLAADVYGGNGLRFVLNFGREIAVGVLSSEPGGGVGFVLRITPIDCAPLGVGSSMPSNPTQFVYETVTKAPGYPGLP